MDCSFLRWTEGVYIACSFRWFAGRLKKWQALSPTVHFPVLFWVPWCFAKEEIVYNTCLSVRNDRALCQSHQFLRRSPFYQLLSTTCCNGPQRSMSHIATVCCVHQHPYVGILWLLAGSWPQRPSFSFASLYSYKQVLEFWPLMQGRIDHPSFNWSWRLCIFRADETSEYICMNCEAGT